MQYSSRMGDGQSVAYKLLGILHHIAPDGEAQNVCTQIFNSYQSGPEQDKAMCLALADGYLYGNWPWVIAKLNK